jgi:hypothetical protein
MTGRYRCYHCRIPLSLTRIKEADRKIEELPPDAYNFLIDALGLHGCQRPKSLFHGAVANICGDCFQATMALYHTGKGGFASVTD